MKHIHKKVKRTHKKAWGHVKRFDEKHTNFSQFTYWLIFITACATWLFSFSNAKASFEYEANELYGYDSSIETSVKYKTPTENRAEVVSKPSDEELFTSSLKESFTRSNEETEKEFFEELVVEEKDISEKYIFPGAAPAEDLLLDLGDIVDDADAITGEAVHIGGKFLRGGTVTFGPYETNLKSGVEYLVRFRMKISHNGSTDKRILVDAYNGYTGHREYRELAPRDFHEINTYQDFEIDFTRGGDGYEFRVFYYPDNNFDLYIDQVEVIEK